MGTMPEIKRVSHKHEAIMEWLIANPERKMGECAAAFGVSPAWLSIIVHSDAFQSRYQALVAENIDDRVIPLRNKLTGVAHRAVEKLGAAVDASMDPDFLLNTADKTLHRLGYAPSRAPGTGDSPVNNTQINNFYSVSQEELEAARDRRRKLYEGQSTTEIQALPDESAAEEV